MKKNSSKFLREEITNLVIKYTVIIIVAIVATVALLIGLYNATYGIDVLEAMFGILIGLYFVSLPLLFAVSYVKKDIKKKARALSRSVIYLENLED